MNKNKYFFQEERRFSKKFFQKGSDIAAAILLSLSEAADVVAEDMKRDSRFALLSWMLSSGEQASKKKPKGDLTPVDISSRVRYLERQGLLFRDKDKNKLGLTLKGKQITDVLTEKYNILKKPWDGKFRIVIFDIPEKKKSWRAELRKELNLMQYVLLQRSVYIGKYPLATSFLKELNKEGISKNVFIFTAEQMDRQDEVLNLLK